MGGVTVLKNPILAARAVMEKTSHVLLTNVGAEKFAKDVGLQIVNPDYFYTDRRWKQLQEWKTKQKNKNPVQFGIGYSAKAENCAKNESASPYGDRKTRHLLSYLLCTTLEAWPG